MIVLPLSVEAGELRITVGGIRSAHDTVLIGLNGRTRWPRSSARRNLSNLNTAVQQR
jgi:hypothetical protein